MHDYCAKTHVAHDYYKNGECECDCVPKPADNGHCTALWENSSCYVKWDYCKNGYTPHDHYSDHSCKCDCVPEPTSKPKPVDHGHCSAYWSSFACHGKSDNCHDGYQPHDHYSDHSCKCDCVKKPAD